MSKRNLKLIASLVILVVVLIWKGPGFLTSGKSGSGGGAAGGGPAAGESRAGEADLLELFKAHRSDVVVQAAGVVSRVLPDDNEGSRHQRLIVKLPSGHTVLIAHNIDLAPRVPLKAGDEITFCGEYEYNEQGGVVHWTHHDPQGRHQGGWIRHGGRTYE